MGRNIYILMLTYYGTDRQFLLVRDMISYLTFLPEDGC